MAYLPLSTANLPNPVIDPATGATPDQHFNTVLYTGNGTTNAITGVGFQPSLIWTKSRSATYDHFLTDELIHNDYLRPNQTNAASAGVFASIDSDGFTISGNSGNNTSGASEVAWNWKANGSGVSNTDGTITSTVSANTTSGFSIVSWTADGSDATIGHGLSSAPEIYITKARNTTSNWNVYTTLIDGSLDFLRLQTTDAKGDSSRTAPTTSVINMDYSNATTAIAYCFHSVEGFSKFGSYTGNGSATDGPFIYTGFEPAFIMVKCVSTSPRQWEIHDNKRLPYNERDKRLFANLSNAEATEGIFDFCANGLKQRSDDVTTNQSGQTYIYMAFARNPFKYANAE